VHGREAESLRGVKPGVTPCATIEALLAKWPAKAFYRGNPAPGNLSSQLRAHRFRTRLREGAKRGPNFAGQMTIFWLDCGTQCS
jgi:hypothetical protein